MVDKISEIINVDEDQVRPFDLLEINTGTFIKGGAVKENLNVNHYGYRGIVILFSRY